MSKRFTDSSKWDKGFFSDLNAKMKLTWLYLCDKCDHAGVWDINIKLLNFQTGESCTIEEIESTFAGKIYIKDGKLLILPFIEFQYGSLNPNNRVHQSVISKLEKLGLYQPLLSPLQGAKDKEEDKDKLKYKEKEQEEEQQAPEKKQIDNAIDLIKPNPTVAFQLRMTMPDHVAVMEEFKIPLVKYHKHMGRIVERFPEAKLLREAVENICSTKVYLDLKKSGTQARRDSYFFKAFDKEIGAI